VNSDSSLHNDDQYQAPHGADSLSIALVGPDADRRRTAARVLAECHAGKVREFSSYPVSLDDVPRFLEPHYDVIIIDLDSLPEYALQLVESICVSCTATVMVYSEKADPQMVVRCMHAGAREFLTLPFVQDTVAKALIRISARRPAAIAPKKMGRLLGFLGAKGGDGVTTLASNFAVSLAQESSESTLLIDLDLPLGDAALNLGISAEYSTINALQNADRLDSSFLFQLLVKHGSGVSVLAAPGKFPSFDASDEAVNKLLEVARQNFDNVVIDMGSRLDLTGTSLFKDGATIYLVIQAGIAGLRNANRLVSQYFATGVPKLEIVLNRYQHRSMGVDEDQIAKALTRPAQWKIPNDFAAVRRMQHTAAPLALEDSAISRVIRQMARAACGLPLLPEKGKKTGFSFKNIGRNLSSKRSASDETPSITPLGLTSGLENERAAVEALPEAASGNVENSGVPSNGALLAAETQLQLMLPETREGSTELAGVAENAKSESSASIQQDKVETRRYRGSTYIKGTDGEWHLQQAETKAAAIAPERETPVIAWSTPGAVVFGTELSAAQLNAMASVPGSFAYTPAAGVVLAAGTHTLSVVFTPADEAAYTTAEATVSLTVTKAAPVVKWPAPAPVVYGTVLGAAQLNATSSVAGKFVYAPAEGKVLAAGTQTLTVTFTPEDATNYGTVNAIVPLIVTRATPVITWPKPVSIIYGTALSAAQLNATASVPGVFAYTPATGKVLTAGLHTLTAAFTPTDSTDYNRARATVPLIVTRATPVIIWPAPATIFSGDALDAVQLNATAEIPGRFVYTPAAGEVMEAGIHLLSVNFTPADANDYAVARAAVPLTVTAKPAAARPAATSAVHEAVFNSTKRSPEFQPAVAESAPSEVERLVARPVHRKVPAEPAFRPPFKTGQKSVAQVAADLPIKAAHKSSAKSSSKQSAKAAHKPVNPPVESAAELAAAAPVETPAKSMVRVPSSNSEIDVGPGLDLMGSAVFEDGTTIYLVMQPGSAGQQRSSRIVSQFFANRGPKPEIVINRIAPRAPGAADGQTSTALTRTAYSPISRLIGQMARPVSEQPATQDKGKGFSFKGIGKKLWSKISTTEKPPSITELGQADGEKLAGAASDAANFAQSSAFAPAAESVFAAGRPQAVGHTSFIGDEIEGSQGAGASSQSDQPETRSYKGATYVKGADGLWHLQKTSDEISVGAQVTPPVNEVAPAKAKARAGKVSAKASSKRGTKAAVKPLAKASGKQAAKPEVKAAAKPKVKAAAKRAVKSASKPAAAVPAKQEAKIAAVPVVKTAASKARPVKKKDIPASVSKPAKPSRPAAHAPAPAAGAEQSAFELPVAASIFEPALQNPDSEIVGNQPVSASAEESSTLN
jgi:pilus assembly protein CpaE